jgi:hypothetical protein
MIAPPGNTQIWIAAGVTDLRRGFTGLSALVQTKLEQSPMSGQVFRWRWTLSVLETTRAGTFRMATSHERHGRVDAGAVVDAVRRH